MYYRNCNERACFSQQSCCCDRARALSDLFISDFRSHMISSLAKTTQTRVPPVASGRLVGFNLGLRSREQADVTKKWDQTKLARAEWLAARGKKESVEEKARMHARLALDPKAHGGHLP